MGGSYRVINYRTDIYIYIYILPLPVHHHLNEDGEVPRRP